MSRGAPCGIKALYCTGLVDQQRAKTSQGELHPTAGHFALTLCEESCEQKKELRYQDDEHRAFSSAAGSGIRESPTSSSYNLRARQNLENARFYADDAERKIRQASREGVSQQQERSCERGQVMGFRQQLEHSLPHAMSSSNYARTNRKRRVHHFSRCSPRSQCHAGNHKLASRNFITMSRVSL